jgi:tetratricopeptide (TPR) repeat protein
MLNNAWCRRSLFGQFTKVQLLPALDRVWNWCANRGSAYSLDLKLQGCTAIIQSGYAVAYVDRGHAIRSKGPQDRGQNTLAISDFTEAIRIAPNYSVAYVSLGKAQFVIGRSDLAFKSLDKAIELNPSERQAYAAWGGERLLQGAYDLAITEERAPVATGLSVEQFLKRPRRPEDYL